mgnify:CR=1 FL=1|jgi:hypothetical protein
MAETPEDRTESQKTEVEQDAMDIDNTGKVPTPKISKVRVRVKSDTAGAFQVTTKPLTTKDVMLFFQPRSRRL